MPGAFNPDVTLPALWTDKPDWINHLRALAATGHINQADADQLAHFADHGWLLMEGAIEPEFVDTLVDDIRKLHQPPGLLRHHRFPQRPLPQAERQSAGRAGKASSTCMSICSRRAMSACIQGSSVSSAWCSRRRCLPFSSFLFQVTNGHRWHQDTAYVVVDTPTLLAATWIALQDIQEGSGELAYYDRSHRLPHYIFSNNRKHNDGDTTDYPRDIETACQARQLAHRRLLAKKGDVFFWTADLAHRSHPLVAAAGHATAVLRDALLSRHLDAALVRGTGQARHRALLGRGRLRQFVLCAAQSQPDRQTNPAMGILQLTQHAAS